MNRRTLLATLAGMPFCGWMKPKYDKIVKIEVYRSKSDFAESYPAESGTLMNSTDDELSEWCARMAKSLDEEMKRKFC